MELQKERDNDGVTYMDTPGLSDVKLREQAAAAIEEALKSGGKYSICFVVTRVWSSSS